METLALTKLCAEFAAGLPDEIRSNLYDDEEGEELVELLVYDDVRHANLDLPSKFEDPATPEEAFKPLAEDVKGAFIGAELIVDEDSQEVEQDPDGVIALIAANIKDPEEAIKVLTHEIGHALGLDEGEVNALGLNVSDKPAQQETKDVTTPPG